MDSKKWIIITKISLLYLAVWFKATRQDACTEDTFRTMSNAYIYDHNYRIYYPNEKSLLDCLKLCLLLTVSHCSYFDYNYVLNQCYVLPGHVSPTYFGDNNFNSYGRIRCTDGINDECFNAGYYILYHTYSKWGQALEGSGYQVLVDCKWLCSKLMECKGFTYAVGKMLFADGSFYHHCVMHDDITTRLQEKIYDEDDLWFYKRVSCNTTPPPFHRNISIYSSTTGQSPPISSTEVTKVNNNGVSLSNYGLIIVYVIFSLLATLVILACFLYIYRRQSRRQSLQSRACSQSNRNQPIADSLHDIDTPQYAGTTLSNNQAPAQSLEMRLQGNQTPVQSSVLDMPTDTPPGYIPPPTYEEAIKAPPTYYQDKNT